MRALPADYQPLRVFVDSNALQALLDHGGTIFENEPFEPYGRSGADAVDVEALRGLMLFAGRGAFEFALSRTASARSPRPSTLGTCNGPTTCSTTGKPV